jgi:hypothetical protein
MATIGGEVKLDNQVISFPANWTGDTSEIYLRSANPSESVLDVIRKLEAIDAIRIDCEEVKLSRVPSAPIGNGYQLARRVPECVAALHRSRITEIASDVIEREKRPARRGVLNPNSVVGRVAVWIANDTNLEATVRRPSAIHERVRSAHNPGGEDKCKNKAFHGLTRVKLVTQKSFASCLK